MVQLLYQSHLTLNHRGSFLVIASHALCALLRTPLQGLQQASRGGGSRERPMRRQRLSQLQDVSDDWRLWKYQGMNYQNGTIRSTLINGLIISWRFTIKSRGLFIWISHLQQLTNHLYYHALLLAYNCSNYGHAANRYNKSLIMINHTQLLWKLHCWLVITE